MIIKLLTILATICSILGFAGTLYLLSKTKKESSRDFTVFKILLVLLIILTSIFWSYFFIYPTNKVSDYIEQRIEGNFTDSKGNVVSIVEGEFRLSSYTTLNKIRISPFESPPDISIFSISFDYGTQNNDLPIIVEKNADYFVVKMSSPYQTGNYSYRARGIILKKNENR